MKILIIGFLVFFGWSALSTHLYVCNIMGLCADPVSVQIASAIQKDVITTDTSVKLPVPAKLSIPDSLIIHFAFDKSEFHSDAQTEKYFYESYEYLNQNSQYRLFITGFADAIGSDEYNQALGFRRAQSMQSYFESKGLPANKIIIESKGEKEPADDNNTTTGRANNRITVITIKK
jgi:OOP family OmpA-OmpF porin